MAGLYIHFPFCRSKCAYCDFYSQPRYDQIAKYCRALILEFEARRHIIGAQPFSTVYLGGGTPSSVPLELIAELLDTIEVNDAVEVTIEANPDDITPEWIKQLRESTSINRISLGVQSFDDTCLQAVGRRHTAAQAETALRSLLEAGYNVSADLIMGLPNQTMDSWIASLDRMLAIRPHHLSAYILSYEPGTRLWAMLQAGKLAEAPETLIEGMYGHLCRRTSKEGYLHYEISNFALPGHESRHNSAYWDTTVPYLGLGPGAHSLGADATRSSNPPSLKQYLDNPTGMAVIETATADTRWNDYVITALRTARGISPREAKSRFGVDINDEIVTALNKGLLKKTDGGRFCIPEEHLLTSDAIMLPFIH